MNLRMFRHAGALMLLFAGVLGWPSLAGAQSMSQYSATPEFVSEAAPNVLFTLSASDTMGDLASKETNAGNWDQTRTYGGLWDSLKCYTFDATDNRFEVSGASKATITSACASTLWDGNFLDWAFVRRFDSVKLAMTGGTCYSTASPARNPDTTCNPYGSPLKPTVTLQDVFVVIGGTNSDGHVTTPGVSTGGGVNGLDGRVPTTVQNGGLGTPPATLYFHVRGGDDGMQGSFCTDDDASAPSDSANSCGDSDGGGGPEYTEQQFWLRRAMDTEPKGVLQETQGGRLGLMVFSDQHQGKLLVPIGAPQNVDLAGSTVETFGKNLQAMLDAVDDLHFEAGSPLNEGLYQSIRYITQLPPAYTGDGGNYAWAFPTADALGGSGVGALGPGEISGILAGETCPGGYVANACGRDPYFFGANHSPPWATPSSVVPCCKTYMVLVTDGESDASSGIPAGYNTDFIAKAGGLVPGFTADEHQVISMAYWLNDKKNDDDKDEDELDLRPTGNLPIIGEAGHDLPDQQKLKFYTLFTFGSASGRNLVFETAKYGGYNDDDDCPLIGRPDCTDEWDDEDNVTGDDDNPDGLPDNFSEGTITGKLEDKLEDLLADIFKNSAAGGGASVLSSSSTGEGAVYQSFFYPRTLEGLTKEVWWAGYSAALWLDEFGNLREDTVADGKMVYTEDQIIRFGGGGDGDKDDDDEDGAEFERFDDNDGNGLPDGGPVGSDKLRNVRAIWEAGTELANTASSSRTIWTWLDDDDDGLVDSKVAFTAANAATLEPYLRADAVAPFTATNMINFIRGDQIAGMRDRELTVGGSLKVWKLGDSVHAGPALAAAPGQRFDVIYGDSSYTAFFAKYAKRRQVVYVGANDGMLHAFNGGFYHRGDDPGTSSKTEHGWFSTTATGVSNTPPLGEELFGFIPEDLLPHLRWLTEGNYSHVYYVDLTPKITDARIFTPDADHPNGWGTILMGGFRLGGSCGNCTAGAPPMTVTADFDGDSSDETRTFYSAYFVLDITNPEASDYPKLLWSFSSSDMGLSTSVPSMLRVNPSGDTHTDNTNAKWYMVVGSGPTGYDGSIAQAGKLYAIDLAEGPGANNSKVVTMTAETLNAFMSATLTIDQDYDYRVDVTYAGSMIDDGSAPWRGKLHRLTMNDCTATPCDTDTWGIADGSDRKPTEVLDTFPSSGSLELGPVTAAPAVAIDDSAKLWVFAGTGRYFGLQDRTNAEQQYFVGVKDSVLNDACTESSATNCHDNNLLDMSSAKVCLVGTGNCGSSVDQVTGVTGATNFPSLISLVASKDGWFTKLPGERERALSRPFVIGGVALFPTFAPKDKICKSEGKSYLYALYYKTGGAYSTPVIGTTLSGSEKYVNKSIQTSDNAMAAQAVVHLGKGSGQGKATVYVQKSTGAMTKFEIDAPLALGSRFKAWWKNVY